MPLPANCQVLAWERCGRGCKSCHGRGRGAHARGGRVHKSHACARGVHVRVLFCGRGRGRGHGHARSSGAHLLRLGRFAGCCNRRRQALALWAFPARGRCGRGCTGCRGRGGCAGARYRDCGARAHMPEVPLLWAWRAGGCCNRKRMRRVR